MSNEKGVWRTVGGRRIFIADGESLSSAMKKSGKFKKMPESQKKRLKDNAKNVNKKKSIDKVSKCADKVESSFGTIYSRLTGTGKNKVLSDAEVKTYKKGLQNAIDGYETISSDKDSFSDKIRKEASERISINKKIMSSDMSNTKRSDAVDNLQQDYLRIRKMIDKED